VGAYGFECEAQPGGVHINEQEFIAEVIDPVSGRAVADGVEGELVMTNLGRWGSPIIRYRTGDLVRPNRERCVCGRSFLRLQGGVLGRADDMIVVRGVNVFPSAIENVMREFSEIEEFKIETFVIEELREVKLTLEPRADCDSLLTLNDKVARRFRERLGLRPQVEVVAPGTLPRFELKARRFFKS
jgi:phenylacetate-CoA ligase